MKYYIVYKTTNLINNKFYIGIHTQNIPPFEFDGYLGSGKLLKLAIAKHGESNFVRETLFVYGDYEKVREKERELVDKEFTLKEDTYNISVGGTGGDTMAGASDEEKRVLSEKLRKSLSERNLEEIYTDKVREKLSNSAKIRMVEFPHTLPNNKGRIHTEEAMHSFLQSGIKRKNRFIWITNGDITVHYDKTKELPTGWTNGRGNDVPKFISHTEESKNKIRNSPRIKGIVCVTNGIDNIKLQPNDEIPVGYVLGMTQKHDFKWYTNGKENKRVNNGEEIENGWYRGRTIEKRK